jgi:hypothetical protein
MPARPIVDPRDRTDGTVHEPRPAPTRWSATLAPYRALTARRRSSLARVRRARAELRPGLYLAHGDAVWVRVGTRLPAHLRETQEGLRFDGPAARDAGALERLRSGVGRTARRLTPPFLTSVTRSRGSFTIAVRTFDDEVVLLDPAGGNAARTLPSWQDPVRYASSRQRLGEHVPIPRASVRGRLVVEEFVQGSHFVDATRDVQLAAARRLLTSYAALTRATAHGSCAGVLDDVGSMVQDVSLPADLRTTLERSDVLRRAREWPLVPSATDSNVKNVVVHPDGRATLIDLGDVRPEPFFSYPLGVIESARGAVLDAYGRGELDAELGALLEAGGAPSSLDAEAREALLAVRVLLAVLNTARREGVLDDPDEIARLVRRRWSLAHSDEPAERW